MLEHRYDHGYASHFISESSKNERVTYTRSIKQVKAPITKVINSLEAAESKAIGIGIKIHLA